MTIYSILSLMNEITKNVLVIASKLWLFCWLWGWGAGIKEIMNNVSKYVVLSGVSVYLCQCCPVLTVIFVSPAFNQVWHQPREYHPLWTEHWYSSHCRPGITVWVCCSGPSLTSNVRHESGLSWHKENLLLRRFPQVSLWLVIVSSHFSPSLCIISRASATKCFA